MSDPSTILTRAHANAQPARTDYILSEELANLSLQNGSFPLSVLATFDKAGSLKV
jgi:hypothetical protein